MARKMAFRSNQLQYHIFICTAVPRLGLGPPAGYLDRCLGEPPQSLSAGQ